MMAFLSAVPGHGGAASPEGELVGVTLSRGPLRIRVVDNTERHVPINDTVQPGYNGLASLIHSEQGRNVFDPAGLNYECSSTSPEAGARKDLWNAPRVAPLTVERVGPHAVKLTQKGAEAAGLNAEIVYSLGDSCVDQTITTWPDHDIDSSSTFWASYMNLVQNTSLFLRGVLEGEAEPRWLEMTSAGHRGGEKDVFFRPFEPQGKAWHEFLTDNPVRRQAIVQTPESVAATESAGFRAGRLESFDNFFFGFVDDYVLVWVFRQPEDGGFRTWISSSGMGAVRRPAWDFGIHSGPQKAGERRTYHVRLVHKRFVDIADVLEEIERFQDSGDRRGG